MKISLRCLSILIMTVLISVLGFGSCFAADNGLVAQYKLNGDCNDASGNGNNGSAVGDVSFVDDFTVGKCAVFNGGYIDVPSNPELNLGGNFTISVWVLVDSVMAANGNKMGSIISKLDDAGNYNNYHAYTRGTFGVRMDTRFTSGENNIQTGPFQDWGLSKAWSHIVLSYDGQNLNLYNNGELKAVKEIKGGGSIEPSNNKMRIGTGNDLNNQNLYYKGRMSDLRIYNIALSFNQIKALYNAGADTKTTSQQPAASGTATSSTTTNGTTNPATGTGNQLPFDDGSNKTNGGNSGSITIINNTTNINNINNTNNTTNNANTNTNITGSTISNSNIASNNQVKQTTSVSNATTVTQYVNVLVNGQLLQSDVNPFVNADGRTMLPIRAIAEALGAQVQWDNTTQTATLTLGARVVKVTVGQNSIFVDGQPVSMDTIAAIKDGRTLLPVRAVGEALGAQIGWDASTQTVSIDK